MRNAASRVLVSDLPDLPGKITASLAAEMLGVSRQAVHRMAKDRKLTAWRVRSAGQDRPVVVDLEEVLEMQKKRAKVVTVDVP
jgi:excisionase family DNA binding protein